MPPAQIVGAGHAWMRKGSEPATLIFEEFQTVRNRGRDTVQRLPGVLLGTNPQYRRIGRPLMRRQAGNRIGQRRGRMYGIHAALDNQCNQWSTKPFSSYVHLSIGKARIRTGEASHPLDQRSDYFLPSMPDIPDMPFWPSIPDIPDIPF